MLTKLFSDPPGQRASGMLSYHNREAAWCSRPGPGILREAEMTREKPENPAVKIASIVGGIIFVIVLMLAIFAKEQLAIVGWIVIPLAVMGVGLAVVASRKRE